jgi:hypothetical protein
VFLSPHCFLEGSEISPVCPLVRYQRLVYADDVNILGGSILTVRKNTEAVVIASKHIGLVVLRKLSI